MAGEMELIEISVLSGQSDRSTLTFTPGTPANPVSVGSAGQWIVSAEGVGPVQLYIVFDGRAVHVAAAAPQAQVLLAGAPVGASWARAPIPCELRFGGACLIMRSVPRLGAASEEEQTVHDGGALWQAAQRAVNEAVEKARQGPPPDGPGVQFPGARPAAGEPANFSATVPLGDHQAFRDAVAKATSSIPPAHEDAPTTIRAPLAGGVPAGLSSQDVTMIAPQPLAPRALTAAGNPGARPGPSYPPPNLQPAIPPGAAPAPQPNAGTAPGEKEKNYWQSASAVKKATLILMPFALVTSYFMLQPEPPPPPPRIVPAGVASAKHAGAAARDGGSSDAGAANASIDGGAPLSDAGEVAKDDHDAGAMPVAAGESSDVTPTASPSATPSADGRPEAFPRMPLLPRGQRTPERLALDAFAAGSFDDAAKRYAALAAAHPDDPAYKEAARILAQKTGSR